MYGLGFLHVICFPAFRQFSVSAALLRLACGANPGILPEYAAYGNPCNENQEILYSGRKILVQRTIHHYSGPMRFAHRGVAQKAPENTEGAFQAAVDEGYEGIELDIHMSRDGEIVICHDSHFSRLTCGHPSRYCIRHLKDMTWEELSQRGTHMKKLVSALLALIFLFQSMPMDALSGRRFAYSFSSSS